jgi:hypothetical protein
MTFVSMGPNLPELEVAWSPTTAATATPSYQDITPWVRSLEIRRGRNDELARFETAEASGVLDNRARTFDHEYDFGPFYPWEFVMRKIRVRARWDGTIYDRFVGYTGDEFPQQYPAGGRDAIVPFTAYDGFGVLALARPSLAFSRPAELSGARIAAVLDEIGWPAGDRSIATGVAGVSAFAAGTDTNALQHLLDVNDAEGGALFFDRSGILVFQDRHHRNVNERTSRYTFSTVESGNPGLHFQDIDVRYGGRVWNAAQITPNSGNVQEWLDTSSKPNMFPRVFTKSLPMSSDTDALALAQYIVQMNKTPTNRCYSMNLAGAADAVTLWPALLSLEVSHHVTVKVTPPARTGTYTFEQSIEGSDETILPGDWRLVFRMSPADLNSYWTLGTSTLGVDTILGY